MEHEVRVEVYSHGLAFSIRLTHIPTGIVVESGPKANYLRSKAMDEALAELAIKVSEKDA